MPTLTFSVTASGSGVRQDVDVVGSGHVVKTDAYLDFGGADAHPSPLALALAALSSCTQVTGSVVARELGIEVEGWDITLDGDFDPTVMVSGREADADPDQVQRLGAETERRCPVSALYRRAGTAVESTWTVQQPARV